MANYMLYLLLSVFIFMNGTDYLDANIKSAIKSQELLKFKLARQALYEENRVEVNSMTETQKKIFLENRKFFFKKDKKPTIVFSDIQEQLQGIMQRIGGKILQLNSGIVIEEAYYAKYPLSLNIELIPEDLDKFFKYMHENNKYLFVNDIHISKENKKKMLRVSVSIIGYQLK